MPNSAGPAQYTNSNDETPQQKSQGGIQNGIDPNTGQYTGQGYQKQYTGNGWGQFTYQPTGQLAGFPAPDPNNPGQYPAGGGTPPSSNFLGQVGGYTTGQTPVFNPNDSLIMGNPTVGADQSYGLNNVWGQIQNALGQIGNGPQNYNTTAAQLGAAPQATAAQGNAAQGVAADQARAAQGQAATGQAAQVVGSSYQAALAAAALGNASAIQQVNGNAALGNAAYLSGPAQMQAAQGGYAQASPVSLSTAGDAAWQAQQQQLSNTLQRQAAGGGMSPADLQLQAGVEQQLAAQQAALGSQRGQTNAAMAQRSIANQSAAANQNANFQAAQLRAQETLQAQQALGGVLGTARGQAQGYNLNAAQLQAANQQYNAGNVQQANMANTGYSQQANLQNAQAAQQANMANQAASNANTQFNVGQQNQMLSQNLNLAQQANQYNATQGQNMTLANMNQQQQINLANQAAQNTAAQYDAGNMQQAALANQAAQNQMAGLNLGAVNQMTGQNLSAANTFGLQNQQNAQQMALANLGNYQQMGLANLGNVQQANLANQAMLGNYGLQQGQFNQATNLANQQYQYQAQNQYMQELGAMMGAETGIAGQNMSAAQMDQQMRQNAALTQYGIDSGVAVNNAQANANAAGAGLSALSSLMMMGMMAASDENLKTGVMGGNPMMQSFLEQYSQAHKSPSIGTPDNGMQEFTRFTKMGQGNGGLAAGINSANNNATNMFSQYMKQQQQPNPATNPQSGDWFSQLQQHANQSGQLNYVGNTDLMTQGPAVNQAPYQVGGIDVSGLGYGGVSNAQAGMEPTGAGGISSDQALAGLNFGGGEQPGFDPSVAASLSDSAVLDAISDEEAKKNVHELNPQPYPPRHELNPQPYPPSGKMVSDDQAKENVISGNRGMQAFLQQQNSQQNAQNNQGAYNNAFMQTGQAPRPQVDRQMPNANQGYGQGNYAQSPYLGGYNSQGGVSNYGGEYGGGFGNMGNYQNGGYQGGGMSQMGGVQQGAWNGGGITQNAGINNYGGTLNGPTQMVSGINAGGISSMGGVQQPPQATPNISHGGAMQPWTNPALRSVAPAPPSSDPSNPANWQGLGNAIAAYEQQQQQQKANAINQSLGQFGWGSQGGMMSDEQTKEKIQPSQDDLQEFLDQLHAKSYHYKPEAQGLPGVSEGPQMGTMAQDWEKSDVGSQYVEQHPSGYKMINFGKALGAQWGALAMLNDRMNAVEGKK